MSNLVVFDFDGIHTADEVLNKLRSLQKDYLIDLEDACVVEREKGGKGHIKQAVNLTALGAAAGGTRGAMWGALVGLLFMNPLAGMAIGAITGAGAGALSGSLADYSIRDDFVKKLSATIPEDSSALFVLFRSLTEDKVLREIEPYKPRVLKTSLSSEAEARLRATLSKAA
jgi:uncharacterized membrane protein